MYTVDVSLQKFILRKVLAMTGTETFTVLSSENLEQTSGGRMIWLVDDYYWNWPYAIALQLTRVQYVLE